MNATALFLSVATVAVAVSANTTAAGPTPVPIGGKSLLPEAVESRMTLHQPGPDAASKTLVDVEGMPFRRALRITTTVRPSKPWSIQLGANLTSPIAKGDVCLMTFWMRSPQSADESGDGVVQAFVQNNAPPHTKAVIVRATAGRDWRQQLVPFKAAFPLKVGTSKFGLFLGYHPQTVDLGGVQVLNYGKTRKLAELPETRVTYVGREPDAAWRRPAEERIERFRKADLNVTVLAADGQPVRDAAVHVAMQRHAFGFGAALVSRILVEDSDNGRTYRDIVEKHYTRIVLENDLKWGPWEVSKTGKHSGYRKAWTTEALKWLADKNIKARGHWLSWGSVTSGGQQRFVGKPAEHRKALFAHITEKVPEVGNLVCEWDAINHPVGWGVTYEEMHGGLDFHVDIFKHCRQTAGEGIRMWINEGQILPGGGRRDAYERIIRYLIEHGQKPDGIGFMGHFGKSSLTPIADLYGILDRYAKLVPMLQVTELDVSVGRDEELQADYLRDAMIAMFSHPNMDGIVMWGFWEGRHWKPDAALYRKDWSIKPAGEAWLDLVKKRWWTDVRGKTDADGKATFRAFKGQHRVTATLGGRTASAAVSLIAGEDVTLRLPAE